MNSQIELMKKAINDASREKGVQWNKVTWYSWTLALLVFFVVIPAVFFYLGTQYGALRIERGESAAMQLKDILTPGGVATTPATSSASMEETVIPKKQTPVTVAPAKTTTGTMTASASGRPEIKGTIMMGPMCTKAENKGQSSCNNQPYQKSIDIYKVSDDSFIKSIAVSIFGTFQTELTPGTYVIRMPKASVLYPRIVTEKPFVVEQGKTTNLSLMLDTGIR